MHLTPRSSGVFWCEKTLPYQKAIMRGASSASRAMLKMKARPLQNQTNIRPVTKHDIAALKPIIDATELFPSEMLDDMIAGYLDGTKPDLWFTCEQNEELISYGYCEPERMTEGTWNLLAIGVTPDQQGHGVGAAMIGYLEKVLKALKARVLLVETAGIPEFALTRDFYAKTGFTQEARIREFYEPGVDKIVFWKAL